MMFDSILNLPSQSLLYLENKIKSMYPTLNPIKQRPLMTTEQYEAIYPYVSDRLYQNCPSLHMIQLWFILKMMRTWNMKLMESN